MTLQATQAVDTRIARRSHTSPTAETLLERLVEHIAADMPHQPAPQKVFQRTPDTVDEILFEADIEDAHYYLVRSRSQCTSRLSLSPRELAIAELVAKGLPNKCIGDVLDISPWTVATHLRRIFAKLEVTSRTAMVAKLLEENLLQLPAR